MKLILGTAQFGLNYGVTNFNGQVSHSEIKNICALAQQAGIKHIDTAIAYGESEYLLGKLNLAKKFSILTKVPSLSSNTNSIDELVKGSLKRLNVDHLEAISFHDAKDVQGEHGALNLGRLDKLKRQGVCTKLGVSLYEPGTIDSIEAPQQLDLIQAPINCFDQRFLNASLNYHWQIHARSIFLQGLLLTPLERLPNFAKQHSDSFVKFQLLAKEVQCDLLTLALAFVLKHYKKVQYLVVGCCSVKQLEQILNCYAHAIELQDLDVALFDDLKCDKAELINPTLWPINK
ncbi:aldo/keto reductase [Pseudoalteromonas sp. SS15]|uniref:aldo/keto reductase n=1 Tax=Pseudoalteromonas sp. SS15 TaxID=3139393 RepID=UPI003BAA2FDB